MTKIALIGSAPSSVRLAPYGDPSWKIFACSPGTYSVIPRCDKFFELHRFEPGVIGKPDTQVPWFSPEYCMWMARQKCVVMTEPVPDFPNSVRLPREDLLAKYGSYFFTSSLAWMFAMALDEIEVAIASGDTGPHAVGLWGVDMAASEEYGYQRAGCQFFAQLAQQKGIEVIVPPESDLLCPAPLYGVCEHSHMHIKLMARKKELEGRLHGAQARQQQTMQEVYFLQGAVDDLNYMMGTWLSDVSVAHATDFQRLFAKAAPVGIDHLQGESVVVTDPVVEKEDTYPGKVVIIADQYPNKGNGQDHEESLHL